MILTTDGLGEFILVAECMNLYEEFANHEDAFATINNIAPGDTGHKTFQLSYTYDHMVGSWPAGLEERVLVKSRYVYGKKRRFKDLKFDLENAYGPIIEVVPNDQTCDIFILIRAITTDFDPETITWNWAVTQANLGLSGDYASYLLTNGQANVDASGLPSRRNTPLNSWNELDAIYGFELRMEPVGSERQWLQAQWHAKLYWPYPPVAYVILA